MSAPMIAGESARDTSSRLGRMCLDYAMARRTDCRENLRDFGVSDFARLVQLHLSHAFASDIVERDDARETPLRVDNGQAPDLLLAHRLFGRGGLVGRRTGKDLFRHRARDQRAGKRNALDKGRHADVAIREHSDDVAVLIDHRNASDIVVPHHLCGSLKSVVGCAALDLGHHQVPYLHGFLLHSWAATSGLRKRNRPLAPTKAFIYNSDRANNAPSDSSAIAEGAHVPWSQPSQFSGADGSNGVSCRTRRRSLRIRAERD